MMQNGKNTTEREILEQLCEITLSIDGWLHVLGRDAANGIPLKNPFQKYSWIIAQYRPVIEMENAVGQCERCVYLPGRADTEVARCIDCEMNFIVR
jgi:hypothetical protein